ncbi:hypothetical protein Q8A73_002585 [Channa argus]|nr:hypothetical protein Q8A73_002585 [Channa argus]
MNTLNENSQEFLIEFQHVLVTGSTDTATGSRTRMRHTHLFPSSRSLEAAKPRRADNGLINALLSTLSCILVKRLVEGFGAECFRAALFSFICCLRRWGGWISVVSHSYEDGIRALLLRPLDSKISPGSLLIGPSFAPEKSQWLQDAQLQSMYKQSSN